MELFSYPTTLDLLNQLKTFCRQKFSVDSNIFKTIKKGVLDHKDLYPALLIEPVYDEIELLGTSQMFVIRRMVNFSVNVMHFNKSTSQDLIRNIADQFKTDLKPKLDDWMLEDQNLKTVFNIDFDKETFNEPVSFNNQWAYTYEYPVIFSSYYKYPTDKIITSRYYGSDYDDLLNTLFDLSKSLPFRKFFRDVITPTDLGNLPALSIMFDEPDTDRETYSAAENYDASIVFQVWDFLATKELALDNHLKNVYNVFDFILKNEDLSGKLDLFNVNRIDYGVMSEFSKPVYASTITTNANFYQFLY